MPTVKRFLDSLAHPEMTSDFYRSLDIPDPEEFPRPGDATGKSPAELGKMLEGMGFEFERKASHSSLYRHSVFPAAIVGIATTASDVRACKNLIGEARGCYIDEAIKLRNAIVVLAAITTSMATSEVTVAMEGDEFKFMGEAMTRFLEDCPRGAPNKPIIPLTKMRERWHLDEVQDNFEELDALSRELVKAAAEQREQRERKFSSDMEALLKTATVANGQRCVAALRKLNKEFNLGAKSSLKKAGVPEDAVNDIEDYLNDDPEARMPQETADKLEAFLQDKRDAKKGKKKKTSGRSFAAKDNRSDPLDTVATKLKKLPVMDIAKLIRNNLKSLEQRQEDREALLQEALREQIKRADEAEAANKPLQDKVAELAKVAELEAERADDLADKLDEAQAAATDTSAVEKLISDLHVAVDGFRVKHAQADLERIEEILLAFQVAEGVEV